jgi:hypothetical protein
MGDAPNLICRENIVRAIAEPKRGEVPARRHLEARRGNRFRLQSPPFSFNRRLLLPPQPFS